MKKISSLLLVLFALGLGFSQAKAYEPLNKLTIRSETVNNKPFLGFVYEIIDKESGQSLGRIDLTQTHEGEIWLTDGSYLVREVERPAGYRQAKDVEIILPYPLDEEGDYTRSLVFYAKHQPDIKPGPRPEFPDVETEKPDPQPNPSDPSRPPRPLEDGASRDPSPGNKTPRPLNDGASRDPNASSKGPEGIERNPRVPSTGDRGPAIFALALVLALVLLIILRKKAKEDKEK